MAQVAFTEQALSDIDDIARYISHDSVHYASLQVQKFLTKIEILQELPLTGRVVPETNLKSIRELIEGNYRIIYRIINKNTIHILTVYHSRRRIRGTVIKKIK